MGVLRERLTFEKVVLRKYNDRIPRLDRSLRYKNESIMAIDPVNGVCAFSIVPARVQGPIKSLVRGSWGKAIEAHEISANKRQI